MSLIKRCRSLFVRRAVERDLNDELQHHIELKAQEYIEAGMMLEEAEYAALRSFGGVEQKKEECRDADRLRWVEDLGQDLRYGLRQLRRNPGFTAVVVLSLALGIGANAAIFTVIDAVLLQSLPVKAPRELVLLDAGASQGTDSGNPYIGRWPALSFDAYQYFVIQNRSFEGIAAFRKGTDPLEIRWPGAAAHGEAERGVGHLVAGNYFQVIGVGAAAGRIFGAADDVPNARPVAVISYDYWQRKFHGYSSAIGRAVDLNGSPFTIAGVAPPEFFGERKFEQPPDFGYPSRSNLKLCSASPFSPERICIG
ncbi:MAG: ABC transporter permease [Terriglobia bacterium]